MNPFSSSLAFLLCVYAALRLSSPVVKGVLDRLLRRALHRIDAAAAGGPETRGALRTQVDNTPGRLLKLLVARALLKSRRKPRSERLAGLFLSLGAAVIGGPLGQDYKRAWTDDLDQAGADGKTLPVMMVHSVSCAVTSAQIRWVERTSPRLRRRFARQYRIGGLLLAAAARSRLSAFFFIAVPATPAVAFTGYLIGHVMGFDAFGWALAALAIIEVPRRTDRWQRERQLAAETRELVKN